MNPAEQAEFTRQIDSMLEKGWIKPSTSPYGHPVLFARKNTGELRMCIDYRLLNKNISYIDFLYQRIDDILGKLAQARYFTKIDVANAYHQVEITPEDQYKSAFQTKNRLYEYVVMPFGLCNAPSIFQRLMHRVFFEDLDKSIMVYLDDIQFIAMMKMNMYKRLKKLQRNSGSIS